MAVIACKVYQDGKVVATPSLAELVADPPQGADGFTWVRVDTPEPPVLRQLQAVFGLHELAVEDATHAHQRPKLEAYGDMLFMVLPTASLHAARLRPGETHLFVGPRFFISVHHGEGVDDGEVQRRCQQLPTRLRMGPMFAAYTVLDAIVDHFADLLETLGTHFQKLEASMFADSVGPERLQESYRLKRRLMLLDDALTPIGDICGDLVQLHDDLIPDGLEAYLRDVEDHAVRTAKAAAGMREMLMAAMQVNLALASIRQNDISKKLTGWAAILAVPTVVFGLYGMNFQHMPELQWRYGYFIVLGLTALVCALLYWRLRRAKWL